MATLTTQDLIVKAREFLNTPFKHQGRSCQRMDCLGLLMCVAKELGLPESQHDTLNYGKAPNAVALKEILDNVCERTLVKMPGCIILMTFEAAQGGHHLGIATDIGIIHAYALMHKVIETSFPREWSSRVVAYYKLRSITYG